MSWKVIAGHFYATESSKVVSPFTSQCAEIVISGGDADVALDFSNFTGTFWTAALADGTYGTIALNVKKVLQSLIPNVASTHWVGGNFTLYRNRVATGSEAGGDYSANYSNTTKLPNFAFKAGNGCGSTNLIVCWGMQPGFQPLAMDVLV